MPKVIYFLRLCHYNYCISRAFFSIFRLCYYFIIFLNDSNKNKTKQGGSILKGIESSCSVQIKFPPKEDTISSWVEVQGTQEAINKCRAEFESILGFKVADSPLEQANLQNIPSNKYGAIIGKGMLVNF